jgi:hypothetical protein
MDFLKKNYEKVLLGLVLLGLVVAVGFLPYKIGSERQHLEDLKNRGERPIAPLPPIDMSSFEAVSKKVTTPIDVSFSDPNKLFNPMPWQLDRNGRLLPATKVGPSVLTVTNISPLYLTISISQIVPIPDSPPAYRLVAENQAAVASREKKREYYCKVGDKNELFKLIEAKGPNLEDPVALIIQLGDSERGELSRSNAFKRVEGFQAALVYPPERRTFANQRVGNLITFNFEEYKIVQVTANEVVLQQASNQQKWYFKFNPAATP